MTYRVTLIPFDLDFRNDYPCVNIIAVGSTQRGIVTGSVMIAMYSPSEVASNV
jgi:hypothetical protein